MVKSYFIGLGGCGLKTVAEVYKRFGRQLGDDEYLYTCVDTDHHTLDGINEDHIIIRPEDFLSFGNANPYRIYHEDAQSRAPEKVRMREWAIPQPTSGFGANRVLTYPDQPLNDGAQAQRMLGHFGVFRGYEDLRNEINGKLSRFKEHTADADGKRDVDVWVFASSCGGTGSSMILDVLYLINRLAAPITNGDANVKLVLYMPQPYINSNRGMINHSLNAYACLWELNAFDNMRNEDLFQYFSAVPPKDFNEKKKFPLYRYVIPVDCETDNNTQIPLDSIYPTIAEMIYYLNIGKGQGKLRSHLSNDAPELYKNMQPRTTVNDVQWTTPLIAYGYRAIRKANAELRRYLETRGKYELLRYGLLDSVEDVDFEKAKKEFSDTHVLSHLVSLPERSIAASNDSLERQLQQYFKRTASWDADGLAKENVNDLVAAIDRAAGRDEVKKMAESVFDGICRSIDSGLNNMIREHGLYYAMKILNIVDDNYLEPLRDEYLKPECSKAETAMNKLHQQCLEYAGKKINKKAAAELDDTLNGYLRQLVRFRGLTEAIGVINRLCLAPNGYLEQLRRGSSKMVGLKDLVNRVEYACNLHATQYDQLAKDFRATINDSMTVYIPSLVDIAKGENDNNWSKNNKFAALYELSVMNQVADRPARKSEEGLGLIDYIASVDKNNTLFVDLIKSDLIKFNNSVESQLITPLEQAIETNVDKPGSKAGEWMKMSLEDALKDPTNKPSEFKTMAEMLQSFADITRVPVLYPVRQNATRPHLVRTMYVGASEEYAKENLGYKDGENTEFVKDDKMTDRYLIMRMPGGYDFWSYKYFLDIENTYMEHRKEVRDGVYGCHIHYAFAQTLDLQKSLEMRDFPVRKRALNSLIRCYYYQKAIDVLRQEEPMAYNQLFGQFTLEQYDNGGGSDEGDFFASFGGGAPSGNSVNLNDTVNDQFFVINIDMQKMAIVVNMNRMVSPNAGEVAMAPNSSYQVVFEKEVLTPCAAFADALDSRIDPEYFDMADMMSAAIEASPVVKDAIVRQQGKILSLVVGKKLDGAYQLAMFIELWEKQGRDKELVNAIKNCIRNL